VYLILLQGISLHNASRLVQGEKIIAETYVVLPINIVITTNVRTAVALERNLHAD